METVRKSYEAELVWEASRNMNSLTGKLNSILEKNTG